MAAPDILTRIARWVLRAPASHVAGAAGGLFCGVTASGLLVRQRMLQTHPVCVAATQQLEGAQEVQRILGGAPARKGFVGGYVDGDAGTAVLTLMLHTDADRTRSAVARVEAEAAEAPTGGGGGGGAAPTRWVLRHLEVQPHEPTPGPVAVLYSVPARRELSPWAPSHEPAASWLPQAARALLPEPAGLAASVEAQRLLGVCATAAALHAAVFGVFRGRVQRVERTRRAMERLALRSRSEAFGRPELEALREAAFAIGASGEGLTPSSDAFYGVYRRGEPAEKRAQLDLYIAAEGPAPKGGAQQRLADVLVRAVRGGGASGWQLVHVSVHDPLDKERWLSQAADDVEGARHAFAALVTDAQQQQQARGAPGKASGSMFS